jgi:hypothetical protein
LAPFFFSIVFIDNNLNSLKFSDSILILIKNENIARAKLGDFMNSKEGINQDDDYMLDDLFSYGLVGICIFALLS